MRSTQPIKSQLSAEWMQLFEATLLEGDPIRLAERLPLTKSLIMDRIEDSFLSAPTQERRLLLGALKTICELERLSKMGDGDYILGGRHAA